VAAELSIAKRQRHCSWLCRHRRGAEVDSQSEESGFTLIELLIVIVILPVVFSGITIAIITSLRDDTSVQSRLADSHDAQITSAYFVRDVESAQAVSTSTGPAVCGSGSQLLGLSWTPTGSNVPVYVSYVIPPYGLNSQPILVRHYCTGASEVDSIVSHDLFSALSPWAAPSWPVATATGCAGGVSTCTATSRTTVTDTVTVNCLDGTMICAQGGLVPTFPTSGAQGIRNVVITVKIAINATQSSYQYTLTASPRDQEAKPSGTGLPPGSAPPAVVLLGSGPGTLNCAGSGGGAVINGTVAVNSSQPGSLALSGGDSLTAGEVYTQDSSTTGSSAPVQPPSSYTSTSTQPYASGPAYPDPHAALPDPPTTGPGVTVYTTLVSITGSRTFAPGIYVFEQGLALSGGANVSGSGVLFFIGIPNAPPGTQTAAYSVSGSAAVSLTPSNSGTYPGVVLFQSRNDSNVLTIAGNGVNIDYGGVIYAPDAPINTSGNGASTAGSIVAASLVCGGSGGFTVGPTFAITAGQTLTSLPGTVLGGTVTGFGSAENVTVHLDSPGGPVLATTPTPLTTGAGGQASFTITIPAGTNNGSHTLVAVGTTSGLASTSNSFTIDVPPSFSITAGQSLNSVPGTVLGGAVTYFGATETVVIHLDSSGGTVLATSPTPVTTGASGQASGFSVTIPAGTSPGTHSLVAVGKTSGLSTTSNSFTVVGQLAVLSGPVSGSSSANPNLGPITVQLQNGMGTPVNAGAGGVTVTLQSSSAGGKFGTTQFGPTKTTVTIASGSNSATFWYGDTNIGMPTITLSASGLTSATQVETITTAPAGLGITITGGTGAPALSCGTISTSYACTGTGDGNGGNITFSVQFLSSSGTPVIYSSTQASTITETGNNSGAVTIPANAASSSPNTLTAGHTGASGKASTLTFGPYTLTITVNS
jgi:prepilin-type N-terminal cleavage/methylation domain-containing protein